MSDLTFGLFLGCIIPNRYPGIEAAVRKLAPSLEIKLEDLKGASCCPAPGVFRSFDQLTWLSLVARNLSIAEQIGLHILTLCNGCYGSLKEANEILVERPEKMAEVNEILSGVDRKYDGSVEVYHIAEVLYKHIGIKKIKSIVKKPVRLNAAVHYGCHILKPTKHRGIDSAERPSFLDELVEAVGCTSVSYKDKMQCCGAGGGVRAGALDVSLDMAREKLYNMRENNAQCIIDICPFCHLQFDAGQVQISKKWNEHYDLPVLHYLQLLGLSAGYSPMELGLHVQYVSVDPILKKLG